MKQQDIHIIIANALEVKTDQINDQTKAIDVEEWDSIGHLSILVALDNNLNGKIAKISEFSEADSIKKIIDILIHHKLIDN